MSKVLELVKEHFGYGNGFTPNELSRFTNIPQKVLSMVLKKYANVEVLYYYTSRDIFYLRTEEEILEKRLEVNAMIDKYELKNKKYEFKEKK